MKPNPKLLPALAVLVVLILSACAAEVSPDSNTNAGGETSGDQNSDGAGGSQTSQLGFDLGHPELSATDPTTVSLDGGSKPQLVEFFAFW